MNWAPQGVSLAHGPCGLVYCRLVSTLCRAMDSEPYRLSSGWALSPTLSHWAASQMVTGHIFTEITLLPPRSTRCTSWGLLEYLSLWPQIHMCGPSTEREEACVCLVAQPCLTICDSMDCSPPGCSVRGITGVSCHFLLQGTFPTQGSNPRLPHWQADSLPLSHQGSLMECVQWA